MSFEKLKPIINNLDETIKIFMNTIPNGCYAEIMGSYAWVEQVGNDEFSVFSIPSGSSLTSMEVVEWENFDREEGLINCLSIERWMEKPTFGLLSSIDGFAEYPQQAFVVSNKGSHPLQKNEEWNKWVMNMYLCVRKHDSTIPDNALELMRETLTQKSEQK